MDPGKVKMQQLSPGQQGLLVGAIRYGAMSTATGYGPTHDTGSISAIRRAHELGVTHFDTAEMFGGDCCTDVVPVLTLRAGKGSSFGG